MDDEKICVIAIILAVLLFAGLAGLSIYDDIKEKQKDDGEGQDDLQVLVGDEVSVDYIGRFLGVGADLGPVFDTSMSEVANDLNITKSQGFMPKPVYDDLTFKVGSGQMIKGFEEAVVGKKEGETFTVTIPPEKAYGASYPELLYILNTTQVIPMKETMGTDEFRRTFPGISPFGTGSFIHPFWRWEVSILNSNAQEVTLMHQPVYGEDYHPLIWNISVVDISTVRNTITLQHKVYEIRADAKVPFQEVSKLDPLWSQKAITANGNNPPMEGLITSLGGTITIDFNKEVSGKTLVFQITVNQIKRVTE